MRTMRNWNALVGPCGEVVFPAALERLHRLCPVILTGFHNVTALNCMDPDFVADIETVENHADVVPLDRRRLTRYPFLRDSSAWKAWHWCPEWKC